MQSKLKHMFDDLRSNRDRIRNRIEYPKKQQSQLSDRKQAYLAGKQEGMDYAISRMEFYGLNEPDTFRVSELVKVSCPDYTYWLGFIPDQEIVLSNTSDNLGRNPYGHWEIVSWGSDCDAIPSGIKGYDLSKAVVTYNPVV